MVDRIVYCTPKGRYADMPEEEVAREYTDLAIKGYDDLISFEENYENTFVEIPDTVLNVGMKEGRDLRTTVFLDQPVTRVGDLELSCTSSSYLFNPEMNPQVERRFNGEVMLPDLDVIRVKGGGRVSEAANIIARFYQEEGWETYISKETPPSIKVCLSSTDRFPNKNLIDVLDPRELRQKAVEETNYDLEDLVF